MHPQLMCDKVKEEGAHVGVAFDGDADRVVFADELGRLIDGDQIMAPAGHGQLARKIGRLEIRDQEDNRPPVQHLIHVIERRRGLRAAPPGLEVEDLLELRPEPGASTRYPFVTLDWARRWPCEEVWKARKLG